MSLLEIIVLIGLVGIAVLSVAIAVCGFQLWKSVRRILKRESED